MLLNARIDVVPVRNTLFGDRVNISGLIPGGDFIRTLAAMPVDALGDQLFLPRASLDFYGRRFLDDTPAEAVTKAVGRPICFAYTLDEVIKSMAEGIGADSLPGSASGHSNGKAWTSAV